MSCYEWQDMFVGVAPHVGAWIEIEDMPEEVAAQWSHPTWVRGLKCGISLDFCYSEPVAPHVGAWIEIA